MTALPPGLAARDAVGDFDHVKSRVAFAGDGDGQPLVTIAIPTFRRPATLVETVRSAVAQDLDRPAGAFEGFRGLYIGGGPEKYVQAEAVGAQSNLAAAVGGGGHREVGDGRGVGCAIADIDRGV